VNEYRAYIVGQDGHFTGYRAFRCHDDEQAIAWAGQLLDGQDVELWSGERFVVLLQADGGTSRLPGAGRAATGSQSGSGAGGAAQSGDSTR